MADTRSLEALYREHFDFVYRKAASLGGPGFDAEDAAQEVFLVVSRKLHTFDGSSRMTTWLYGITLNVVRAARRRARVRKLFELRHPEEERGHTGLDRVEVGQARTIAYAILDRMSPDHRDTFILAEFEGLSGDEIARMMRCKVETVWSRLHYARKEFSRRVTARGLGTASVGQGTAAVADATVKMSKVTSDATVRLTKAPAAAALSEETRRYVRGGKGPE